MLTPEEALERLERHLSRYESASAWCRAHAISRHLLSDVRAGRVPMTATIAQAIGLEKVTAYVETEWDEEWMRSQVNERRKLYSE